MTNRLRLIFAGVLLVPTLSFGIGAIAVDDEEGIGVDEIGYWYVVGEESEADAKKAAMQGCKKAGNTNCKIAGWFKNCGAYSASKKYSGFGYGKTKEIAINKSLEECGNKNCKVVVAECDE
jgi:hypothetical protein